MSKNRTLADLPNVRFQVDGVSDLPTIGTEDDVCIVTDDNQGGTFVYRAANSAVNNGGTIFLGWTRQYSGAVKSSWFSTLQEALTTGESVKIVSGTTLVTSTLTLVTSGQKVFSDGNAILKSNGLTAGQAILQAINLDDIIIDNIIFDCNAETYTGINVTIDNNGADISNIKIHNCRVSNTFDTSSSLYGAIMVANSQGAAYTYNIKGVEITENTIDNSTASGSSHGCLVAYCNDVDFTNNNIVSAGFHGMEAVGCHQVVMSNNTVKDCLHSGLGVGSSTKNFTISNNTIDNCAGDGAITCEHNSVQGTIDNNIITDASNQGINVSYGTAGAAPFNEVNNITVSNNLLMGKAGASGKIGINVYSSTGAAIGDGINILNNTIDGFAVGVTATWLIFGKIEGNTVRRFGTGTNIFINIVGCDKMIVSSNICSDNPTADAIIINTSSVANSRCIIVDNIIQSATAGALVGKIGNGETSVIGNKTFGAVNYFSADGTQNVLLSNNYGALSGTPTSGGTLVFSQGNSVSTEDFTSIGGKKHFYGTAAPTSGTWARGDIVFHTNPVASGAGGWICVTAGTPGTWKTYTAIGS